MASLRSAGVAPREGVVEVTEKDHGRRRLVCFGALDNDGRNPTWLRLKGRRRAWSYVKNVRRLRLMPLMVVKSPAAAMVWRGRSTARARTPMTPLARGAQGVRVPAVV